MSVPKHKRSESSMEFLDNAYKLRIYTVKQCISLPKRYTFYGLQSIGDLSFEILSAVKAANSIYPTNAHEFQIRRDYFLKAYGETQALISQLNALQEIFSIPSKSIMQWMELIQTELRVLKGIMKSDKRTFKEFCKEDECSEIIDS